MVLVLLVLAGVPEQVQQALPHNKTSTGVYRNSSLPPLNTKLMLAAEEIGSPEANTHVIGQQTPTISQVSQVDVKMEDLPDIKECANLHP